MTKRRRYTSLIVLILLLLFWQAWQWWSFLTTPLLTGNNSVEFVVRSGVGMKSLATELYKKGVVDKPTFFIWLARITGKTRSIQAGEYRIEPGTTPSQLLKQMVEGKVILRGFTIIDGNTFKQMMSAIEADSYLQHTLKEKTPDAVMKAIGAPGLMPEGRFDPNTYLFSAGITDVEVLRKAYNAMAVNLKREWKNRARGLPYKCPYEALTAASIIEKETAVPAERAEIAGVIVRRLRKKMYLQLDPTVIYGLGSRYKGKLTSKDLTIKTPYNTYLHKGLPPTPISFPSLASLKAALHPDGGKALYFVAKGDGSHIFSETLAEHNKAVIKYLRLKNGKTNNQQQTKELLW